MIPRMSLTLTTSRSIWTKSSVAYLTFIFVFQFVGITSESSIRFKDLSGSLKISLVLRPTNANFNVNLIELEGFEIVVWGRHFKRKSKIINEVIHWHDVPENLYNFQLLSGKGKLEYSSTFKVNKGQVTELELHWVGNDHRISKDSKVWFLKTVGGWGVGYRWDYGDWQKSNHADGKVEVFHQGMVFGRHSSQEIYSRFDLDNDLISDSDDLDDDNDGIYDSNDPDDDNDGVLDFKDISDNDNDNDGVINELEIRDSVLGNLQVPVIESYSVTNLDSSLEGFSAERGDLILITLNINRAGGKSIESVNCSLFKDGREQKKYSLLDDGSIEDLDKDSAGRQISGDMFSGDSIYSQIMTLDGQNWINLYPSTIACRATNKIGKVSQTVLLFPKLPEDQIAPESTSSINDIIDKYHFGLFKTKHADLAEKLEVKLRLKKPLMVKVYLNNRTIFLEPEKKTLKFTDYSDSFSTPRDTMFLMKIFNSEGAVLYLGERIN